MPQLILMEISLVQVEIDYLEKKLSEANEEARTKISSFLGDAKQRRDQLVDTLFERIMEHPAD